jgi:hypothetical protein
MGGTDELHRGRRIVLRVLPPATAAELAGLPVDPPVPSPVPVQSEKRRTRP